MSLFRRKAKPTIGSVYPSTYNLDDDIAKLYEVLGKAEGLAELAKSAGWETARNRMLQTVKSIDRNGIWVLAADPVKNEKALVAARAARQAILLLLATVEGGGKNVVEHARKLHQKLELLNDLPEPAGASNAQPRRRG